MNRNHPPIYYKVRTVVRCAFWGSLTTGLFLGTMELTDDDRPFCRGDVRINFTWDGPPQDLSLCQHPEGIVLEDGGTWRWYDPELDA